MQLDHLRYALRHDCGADRDRGRPALGSRERGRAPMLGVRFLLLLAALFTVGLAAPQAAGAQSEVAADTADCVDGAGAPQPCTDSDGDGAADDVDTRPFDACESPADPGWVALPTNDCDGDGLTVGNGDLHDVDQCTSPGDPNWVELPSNDCDHDSTTVGGGDSNDFDPCIDATFAPPFADCDGDGTTVGQGDRDDFDSCVDLTVQRPSNDCDGDGITVADGDTDDCVNCEVGAGGNSGTDGNDTTNSVVVKDSAGTFEGAGDGSSDGVGDEQPSIRRQLLHDGVPVANTTITIVDSEGNSHTVTTDENGWYELTGTEGSPLASGPATVTYELDGETFTQTIEILPPGQDSTASSRGGVPCVSSDGPVCFEITGRVWFDANQNGVLDGTESDISGVKLDLSQGGVWLQSAFTASPYVFGDLPPGTYDIQVDPSTLPEWLTATYGIDADLGQIVTVTIVDGDITNIDFAFPLGPSPMAPDQLAFTGVNSTMLAQLGSLSILVGFGLVTLAGRREESAVAGAAGAHISTGGASQFPKLPWRPAPSANRVAPSLVSPERIVAMPSRYSFWSA